MMTSKIFGVLIGLVGVGFILLEIYTAAFFGLPGTSLGDGLFYIVLGTLLVALAMMMIFYKDKEDE